MNKVIVIMRIQQDHIISKNFENKLVLYFVSKNPLKMNY